jgi:hypothetical protein
MPSCFCTPNLLALRSSCPQHFSHYSIRSAGARAMLRLRPSELMLTPDDIDEAFRRMATRRTLKDSRHGSSQFGRPILHQGPQRAVQDAITTLGHIPLLRPQAQHVVHTSVNDEDEDNSEQNTSSAQARVESVPNAVSPTRDGHNSQANMVPLVSSSLRVLQLPFRLERTHRDGPTQSPGIEHRDQGDTASPPHIRAIPIAMPSDSPSLAEPTRSTLSAHSAQSPNQAELRGGGDHAHDFYPDTTPLPFPSDGDDGEPSQPYTGLGNTKDRNQPTRYLKSHVKEPTKGADRPAFEIRERWPYGSQTEPRHASGRLPSISRSHSSGSAPTYGLHTREQGYPTSSTDLFDTPTSSQPGTRSALYQQECGSHPPATRPRQFSSEASAASGAYSFYELPPVSREGSGSHAGSTEHFNAPYDGSAASRHVSGGAYHSVRPSDVPPFGSTDLSSRHSTSGGQYGISPLPSLPYTRQNTYAAPSTTSGTDMTVQPLVSHEDALRAHGESVHAPLPVWNGRPPIPVGYQAPPPGTGFMVAPYPRGTLMTAFGARPPTGFDDAATAVMQNSPSPLGYYSDYYQHTLVQQTIQQSPQYPPLSRSVAAYPIDQYGAAARHNTTDAGRGLINRPPSQNTLQYPHSPCSQYPPGTIGRPPQQLSVPNTQHPDGASSRASQSAGRDARTARASQRSSENAHVLSSAQSNGPSRDSQVQRHREAYEAIHNWNPNQASQHDQSRFTLPRPTAPRDASNELRVQESSRDAPSSMQSSRRTPQMSSSPFPPVSRSPSAPLDPSAPAYRPSRSPPEIPARNGSNMRGGGAPERAQTRARRRITPARSPNHLHPSRASLPPSHAATVRSPLLRVTTSVRPLRRVPPQQRDQENSGAGEEHLMRQEAAAIQARYGEDVQRDVMDETPPRVGRVERRMFS